MAILKANYLRRGRRAMQMTRKAAQYYTFRNGPDRAQRVWQTSDGRTAIYAAVQAEIQAAAQTYSYTYRMVVSTKEVDIREEGYRAALGDRFDRYYFIEHHNTAYPHAHVLGFCEERLTTGELQAMRGKVRALEQVRGPEQQIQRDQLQDPARRPA